jgi:septal ring factor EnvC (AmiA/AmiB activator)
MSLLSSNRHRLHRGLRPRFPAAVTASVIRVRGIDNKIKRLSFRLLCAAALAAQALGQPALAQTDTQIQSIQQQIKALQTQLNQMKADLAARDRAVRAAQEQARATHFRL